MCRPPTTFSTPDAGVSPASGPGPLGLDSGGTCEGSRGPATQVEQRIDVAAMLDSLPPEYREVIVLREWQQMSYAEMAATLGVPERTAETRLTRARRMLRQRFGGQ